MKKEFTAEEAKQIGDSIGIDWSKVDLEQFRLGLAVELEHGLVDAETNVTNDNLQLTGKIAWAHLKEISDYYTWLLKMEKEAEATHQSNSSPISSQVLSRLPTEAG